MKNLKALLYVLTVAGIIATAKAQYIYYPQQPSLNVPESLQGSMGYFTLNLGLVQPVGMYSSTKSTSYGGYAMPGSVVSISAGLTPEHSNFGVAFLLGNYVNPFNANQYAANIGQSDQAPSYAATARDDYVISNVMAGFYYTVPVKKISFDFRLLGGAVFCGLPEVAYTAYQYDAVLGTSSYYNWDTEPSLSTALAYDAGAGIRYNFGNMAVMLNADYMYSNPQYNTTEKVTDAAGNESYMNLNGNIKISALTYTIGFGYQLGR